MVFEGWHELPVESIEWCKEASVGGLDPGEIDLWRIRSDETCYEAPEFLECLSAEEKARADRFRFEKDRRSYRVTHACKRWILGRYTNVSPFGLRFENGKWGKPAIQDPLNSFRFNLSHSKGMTLIGITREVELGVDVESRQSAERMTPIFERFASSAEQEWFGQGWEGEMGELMTGWWVSKEAFIKAVGRGLSLPLADFSVERRSKTEWVLGRIPAEFGSGDDYSLRLLPLGSAHIGAVVCKRRVNILRGYSAESVLPKMVSALG